jgi:hypothetical protein
MCMFLIIRWCCCDVMLQQLSAPFIIYSFRVQLFNNTTNNHQGFVVGAKAPRVHSLTHCSVYIYRDAVELCFLCLAATLFMLMSKGFMKANTLHLSNANTHKYSPEEINALSVYSTRKSLSCAEIKSSSESFRCIMHVSKMQTSFIDAFISHA